VVGVLFVYVSSCQLAHSQSTNRMRRGPAGYLIRIRWKKARLCWIGFLETWV